jgi:cystathionine beta-synthase
VFNDAFMAQEGWFGRPRTGTVRDVVINRFDEGSEIFVRPAETVQSAFARMRAADVSQLPVIEDDRVVGLVEESDLLDALVGAGEDMAHVFRTPVGEIMVSRLETIPADAPVGDLLPLFRRGLVPLVMDAEKFLGLVTRIDLINHFRIRDR